LMQYTGLKDKNGVEIYEGDILDISGNLKGTITFLNGAFVWLELEDEGFWQHLCEDYEKMGKVIGNIYENPELFKELK